VVTQREPEDVQEVVEGSRQRAERFLAAVAELGPELEAAGAQAEAERTLPPATVRRLREAGFFWMKTPLELGGSELTPLDFCDVLEALAYHDASAAWTVMIGNGVTGLMSGSLGDSAIAEIFGGGGSLPIMAGQFVPRGVAVAVDGGYRVSGRWSFASGIMHAEWACGGCRVEGGEEVVLVCVPKSEATVLDTWRAAGLEGTGSHDFTLEDQFVASEFTMPLVGRGARGGPLFKLPHILFVANELSPFALGVARRAFDELLAMAPATARGFSGLTLAERPSFQKSVGEAYTEIRGAELLYRGVVRQAWEHVLANDEPLEASAIAKIHACHTATASMCLHAIAELFRYGGGRVLSSSNSLQRHYRNLIALGQHAFISDETFETAGAVLLGEAAAAGEPPPGSGV
jgi:indole-3-acetate monooxygenase